MIIYDYANYDIKYTTYFFSLGFLFSFGLIFYLISMEEPKSRPVFFFFKHNFKSILEQRKLAARIIGIFLLIFGLIVSVDLGMNYLYIKQTQFFEKIEITSGKIKKIDDSFFFGKRFIAFEVAEINFNITRDMRYISQRNLLIRDSVRVSYFKKKKKGSIEDDLIVTKIELFENGPPR